MSVPIQFTPSLPGSLPKIRAVIDIGTNSIKLLVGEVSGRHVRPLWEESEQTRLGRGFYEAHKLQTVAMAETTQAVVKFLATAQRLQAGSLRVIATSAVRDAHNAAELTGSIFRATGLPTEIISGEQEADLAFQGVTSDPTLAEALLLILDVGGGSTEFILGEGSAQHFRHSFALGTVRLLEKFPPADPPGATGCTPGREWLQQFLETHVQPVLATALKQHDSRPVQLVATGGTATILARLQLQLTSFDRERIEALRIRREQIRHERERLWECSLAERRQIPGLPADRADVILFGVLIYEAVMEQFGLPDLRVTTRGLRYAALMDPPSTGA
jgi:exopolyphosphatase/guanosine-5'-triphosphate,3'-diphosphate pyrophosphatase